MVLMLFTGRLLHEYGVIVPLGTGLWQEETGEYSFVVIHPVRNTSVALADGTTCSFTPLQASMYPAPNTMDE